MSVIILANGDFPTHPVLLEMLRHAERLICCDGAIENLHQRHIVPDVVVGDLDSISPRLRTSYRQLLVHEEEQETNDLCKAFRFCLRNGWSRDIVILGAMGKREDHLLGNIAHLQNFVKQCPSIRMETDFGTFIPVLNSGTFASPASKKLSVFSWAPDMPIMSKGLKYPLHGQTLPFFWSGTLNETTDSFFSLEFDGRAPVLLYFVR